MSQQARSILSLSVVATTVIAQYRGVSFTGGQIASSSAKIIGISERPAVIGEAAIVTSKGTAIAEAGIAIAIGSALAMDSLGRVVGASPVSIAAPTITPNLSIAAGAVAVTSTAANGAIISGTPTSSAPVMNGGDLPQYIVGYAMQAAGAAGDLIEILLS